MIGIGLHIGNRVMGGGFDADAQAFFDRVTVAGGTLTTTEKNATNQLVLDMKSAGIWSLMKAVYPMVGASVNLLSYTENFATGFWGGSSSKTPNYGVAPDGTTTACRFFNGGYMQTQGISKGQGTYVFSFYVKMTSGGTGSLRVFLDGGVTTTTVNVTSNWARVQVTQTFASTDTGTAGFYTDSDVLIWHPQLELGSTATTYAPVAGSRTAEAAAACAQNLKSSSFTGTFTATGWTFASTGVTPNGTSAYMDTGLIPNTSLLLNSTHGSSYCRTNAVQSGPLFSAEDASNYNNGLYIWPNYSGGTISVRINDDTSTGGTNTSTLGFHLANRTSSSIKKYLRNNVSIINTTVTSTGLNTSSIYLAASRNNANYTNYEQAFASFGDGLTDTQASDFYTAVQAFQTTLSRQV